MAVTLQDIANNLNLSKMTVSRVLNNKSSDFITEATRKRVRETARAMGYVPNRAAQALVTGRTRRIAFLSPSMGSRFFQEVAYCFHQLLHDDKYEMVAGELETHSDESTQMVDMPGIALDGVLMYAGARVGLTQVLGSNLLARIPIVNMGPHCSENFDAVNIDLYPASCRGVEFLLDSGAKRIAHMHTANIQKNFDDRYRGYTDIINRRGAKAEYIATPDWSRAAARKSIQEYVKANGCPEGLFCGNDDIAIGAYRGLRDMGISIPGQVRLIGCDGIEDVEYIDPPISTIAQPVEDMCVTAWKFLRNRLEKPKMPRQMDTKTARLVIRE